MKAKCFFCNGLSRGNIDTASIIITSIRKSELIPPKDKNSTLGVNKANNMMYLSSFSESLC